MRFKSIVQFYKTKKIAGLYFNMNNKTIGPNFKLNESRFNQERRKYNFYNRIIEGVGPRKSQTTFLMKHIQHSNLLFITVNINILHRIRFKCQINVKNKLLCL